MKARIDYKQQIAYVGDVDTISAGWLGFWFATDYADLVQAGWRIYYGSSSSAKRFPEVAVGGAYSLAWAIRAGPPPPPQASGFVGPFGEGSDA